MIAEQKRDLILSYGNDVEVLDGEGNVIYTTRALIGKATKQAMTEIALEYNRKGIFVPELDIRNGSVIKNVATGEQFLSMANMTEVYGSEKLSTILRMVLTNATVTVTAQEETADEDGNVSSQDIVKADNRPVYIEFSGGDLVQYKPGLHEDARYVVYMAATELSLLDKFVIKIGQRQTNVKVMSIDYLSFDGLVIVYVMTETR